MKVAKRDVYHQQQHTRLFPLRAKTHGMDAQQTKFLLFLLLMSLCSCCCRCCSCRRRLLAVESSLHGRRVAVAGDVLLTLSFRGQPHR